MTIDNATYEKMMDCKTFIYDALLAEMGKRRDSPGLEWVDNERVAVAIAATEWAMVNGFPIFVTPEDVESIEHSAVGHVDYASKLSLYVAEYVLGVGDSG